jgi:hypothetical protein
VAHTTYRLRKARRLHRLAFYFSSHGDLAEASHSGERALALLGDLPSRQHLPEFVAILDTLAGVQQELADHAQATALAQRAVTVLQTSAEAAAGA